MKRAARLHLAVALVAVIGAAEQATIRPADGVLVLGHKGATPWDALDTLGPTASDVLRFAGNNGVRAIARDQARLLDSLRTYGPGTEPAP